MTNPDVPDLDRSSGERALDVATDQLRDQPASPHVAQAAGRVLARALAAPRRASTIETADPLLQVSSVALVARYGTSVPESTEATHAVTRRVLTQTLGTGPAPGADDVTQHVHVSDVTHGDPHLAEPLDEDEVGDA